MKWRQGHHDERNNFVPPAVGDSAALLDEAKQLAALLKNVDRICGLYFISRLLPEPANHHVSMFYMHSVLPSLEIANAMVAEIESLQGEKGLGQNWIRAQVGAVFNSLLLMAKMLGVEIDSPADAPAVVEAPALMD